MRFFDSIKKAWYGTNPAYNNTPSKISLDKCYFCGSNTNNSSICLKCWDGLDEQSMWYFVRTIALSVDSYNYVPIIPPTSSIPIISVKKAFNEVCIRCGQPTDRLFQCGPCGDTMCGSCWEKHRFIHGYPPRTGITYTGGKVFGFDGHANNR